MATVAFLNGKTLGFGAPPAREMRDGGDLCINSARVKGKKLDYNLIIARATHTIELVSNNGLQKFVLYFTSLFNKS